MESKPLYLQTNGLDSLDDPRPLSRNRQFPVTPTHTTVKNNQIFDRLNRSTMSSHCTNLQHRQEEREISMHAIKLFSCLSKFGVRVIISLQMFNYVNNWAEIGDWVRLQPLQELKDQFFYFWSKMGINQYFKG